MLNCLYVKPFSPLAFLSFKLCVFCKTAPNPPNPEGFPNSLCEKKARGHCGPGICNIRLILSVAFLSGCVLLAWMGHQQKELTHSESLGHSTAGSSVCDPQSIIHSLSFLTFQTLQRILLGSLLVLATFMTICNAECYVIPLEKVPDGSRTGKFFTFLMNHGLVERNFLQVKKFELTEGRERADNRKSQIFDHHLN